MIYYTNVHFLVSYANYKYVSYTMKFLGMYYDIEWVTFEYFENNDNKQEKHIEIANPSMKYEITFLTLQCTIILNNILQFRVVINVLINSNVMFNYNQHSYLKF
jgi:hypothetical protein